MIQALAGVGRGAWPICSELGHPLVEHIPMIPGRFLVQAPSVNAVRRALGRAPGGVRVMGRHDRDTIACRHTMNAHSLARHWPVIRSRLAKAGLCVLDQPHPPGCPAT